MADTRHTPIQVLPPNRDHNGRSSSMERDDSGIRGINPNAENDSGNSGNSVAPGTLLNDSTYKDGDVVNTERDIVSNIPGRSMSPASQDTLNNFTLQTTNAGNIYEDISHTNKNFMANASSNVPSQAGNGTGSSGDSNRAERSSPDPQASYVASEDEKKKLEAPHTPKAMWTAAILTDMQSWKAGNVANEDEIKRLEAADTLLVNEAAKILCAMAAGSDKSNHEQYNPGTQSGNRDGNSNDESDAGNDGSGDKPDDEKSGDGNEPDEEAEDHYTQGPLNGSNNPHHTHAYREYLRLNNLTTTGNSAPSMTFNVAEGSRRKEPNNEADRATLHRRNATKSHRPKKRAPSDFGSPDNALNASSMAPPPAKKPYRKPQKTTQASQTSAPTEPKRVSTQSGRLINPPKAFDEDTPSATAIKVGESKQERVISMGGQPNQVKERKVNDKTLEEQEIGLDDDELSMIKPLLHKVETDRAIEWDRQFDLIRKRKDHRLRDEKEHFQGLSNFEESQRGLDGTRESHTQQIPDQEKIRLDPETGKKKRGRPRKIGSVDASPASKVPQSIATPIPKGPAVTERQLADDLDSFRSRMEMDLIALEEAAAQAAKEQKAYSSTIAWDYDFISRGGLRD
ncbi:uncharacterized protein RCO7_07509 [Rhynchosporium graminicola]|uniref:Uncharacterized protein n=1 Tax=Rhynchosporium graminicola TaxID=2792576 RepID=A0A1E1LJ40_9HELO|nr:uncharacterized protein RCO7_07509 [Rhynchosporium commune]